MGCNAIRTSHNPYAAEFMDLCDRMGFLVMNEAFDEWRVGKGQIGPYGYANYFDEWYERDVKDFVHRDRNHPGCACGGGQRDRRPVRPEGRRDAAQTARRVSHEDPTRLVTAGCDRIASDPDRTGATRSSWRCWTWWATTMWIAGATASRSTTASTARRSRKGA